MKKNKQKKIGRPNPILYTIMYCFVYPYYRLRYGMTIDRTALRGINGPALVLVPHTSNKDHLLVGMALYPLRPNFVISEHFLARPLLRFFMRLAHTISKKMFCADVSTILNLMRAKREGNVIVLFPEGRLACAGRTGQVTDGTAALAKKLGVDVYVVTANGASLTFPKWAHAPRRGKIRVTAERLYTKEQLATLSLPAIEAGMQAAIDHDDFAAMRGVRYRSSAMAEGLDGILYRCPVCHSEGCLTTSGDHILCTCGLSARLDECYRLHGAPFTSILAWYDWQSSLADPDTPLTTHAVIGTTDEKGYMDREAGEATVYMDREVLRLEGSVNGEPLSFTHSTEKLAALPITVGSHFDVYHNNRLYYVSPRPDPRAAVKWVAWLDRLQAERRITASEETEAPMPVTVGVSE